MRSVRQITRRGTSTCQPDVSDTNTVFEFVGRVLTTSRTTGTVTVRLTTRHA